MRLKTIATAAILTVTGTMAQAQEAALCHHAGLTYSPGSMVRMGQILVSCKNDGGAQSSWQLVGEEGGSANCISGGREFGQGTVLAAGSGELICRNGIWFKNQ